MKYSMKERIGHPDLFVGRKKELNYYLRWIDNIKGQKSKSTAILARRKMGKTALLERLFNITFDRNDGVIPFYYEVKESKQWAVDFCVDFFLSFIFQYTAFKTRKTEYLFLNEVNNFDKALEIVNNEGLEYLTPIIESVALAVSKEHIDNLWLLVRDVPKKLAGGRKEYIVQMIDEFQFLNSKIYRDKKQDQLQDDMAAGYLSTAESKVSPLLVSGSWVGWLTDMLTVMLPARFKYKPLSNLPEDEAIEMIYKHSHYFDVPIAEETGYLIARVSEGSPFYISSIINSEYENKDLTTTEGLVNTLEFETLSDEGEIKSTWMTYVATAFDRVNDIHAKNIVLYLCKNREREITRKELLEKLKLHMSDQELEHKLKALLKADIIDQGQSNFRYHGVRDNIFEKVFRGVYQEEIESFEPGQIKIEYKEASEKIKKQYRQLQGKFNYQKGYFAEYVILDQLIYHTAAKNDRLKSITRNLPPDFDFGDYENAWTYRSAMVHAKGLSVDILARAKNTGNYSIIGEVKNRDTKKFNKEEAEAFLDKFEKIKEIENLSPVTGFIFSRKGFTQDAETFLDQNGIAFSDNEQWLDI